MLFNLKHILLILILLFPFKGKSQYAIAGVAGGSYTDIVPDTVIGNLCVIAPNYCVEYDTLDFNGDGIKDVLFYSVNLNSSSGAFARVEVKSLNSNIKLGFGSRDSTWHIAGYWVIRDILKKFNYSDTIDQSNFNPVIFGHLGYYSSTQGTTAFSNQWVNSIDKNIGVSYLDTVTQNVYYGWIRVNLGGISLCTIKDYSLFAPLAIKIKELVQGSYSIKVFPNPSSEGLNCFLKEHNGDVKFKLNDISGKEIQVDFIKQEEGKYYIDTKKIADGIYFLEIENSKEITRKKIVIQH